MPELPEVETVRRGLQRLIIGKIVKSVSHDTEKSFPNSPSAVSEFIVGSSILKVHRRAKVLLLELSSNYVLMVHLKMTGQIVFVGDDRFGAGHPNDSLINNLPDKSTRVVITFTDGSTLYFNDQRKFGWMKLLPKELVNEEPFMQKVGPEPLEPEFTATVFVARIRRRKGTSIKAALLDQTVLAGVGNIYADESLWGAKIHPATIVKKLDNSQLEELYKELKFVLELAIEKGGSTDKNYVNAEGKKGSYIDFARVFRREGLACPRCSTIIEKSRVAGRGTHTCPVCQMNNEEA
jgi:formamidopyrimidine-DNA glycosylase